MLGEKLYRLRQQKHLSIEQASNLIGFSKSYLWGLEKGKVNPSSESLQKLADFYKVTTDYLLFDYNEECVHVATRIYNKVKRLSEENQLKVEKLLDLLF